MKLKPYLDSINEQVTDQEANDFVKRWKSKLKSYGLTHIEFSTHFIRDRLNDKRNSPPIKVEELDHVMQGFLNKFGDQFKKDVANVANHTAKKRGFNKKAIPDNEYEFTVSSNKSKVNLVFVLKQDRHTKGTAMILPMTIQRKKNWKVTKGDHIIVERREIMDIVEKYIGEAKLSVPDKHQKKIAIDTVKNPMKALLGGPSAEEAEEILRKKFKYSDAQIKKLKGK